MPARSTSSDMPSTWVRLRITQLAVGGAARRDGEAAVADHRGGHAERGRGRDPRIPGDLRVVVRVVVDDARHQREAVGVDACLLRWPSTFPMAAMRLLRTASRRAWAASPARRAAARRGSRGRTCAVSILTRMMNLFELDRQGGGRDRAAQGASARPPRRCSRKHGARGRYRSTSPSGCDVTDEAAVKAAFERIGEIDILVNNAGRAVRKPAVEICERRVGRGDGPQPHGDCFSARGRRIPT